MREELIGKQVTVVKATNPSLQGIKGIVIDETKHMLIIDAKKRKRVPKRGCTFKFGDKIVEGRDIEIAPAERIKYGKRN